MKLIQTMVAGHGFREPKHNPTRLNTLRTLFHAVADQGADLLLLPGGFLTARTERELPSLVAQLTELADVAKIAVAVGVDLPEAMSGKAIRPPQLPYFGVVCGTALGGPWRQTSSTGENAADVAEGEVPGANRVVSVAGSRVGVLICGELFSWWARQSSAELELKLALDLGYYGMGTGVTRACENIARNGKCAVAHTHHVAGWNNQSLHFVGADGVRESIPLNDCEWVGDEFWIAWCVRTI